MLPVVIVPNSPSLRCSQSSVNPLNLIPGFFELSPILFTSEKLFQACKSCHIELISNQIIEHFDLIYPLLGVNANLLIGVGEQIDDLMPFDAKSFAEALI